MSEPKTDGVRRIFREMKIGEQPAQRRTKDIRMHQTTTTSEAEVFPTDRPKPELRAVHESDEPANLIVSPAVGTCHPVSPTSRRYSVF